MFGEYQDSCVREFDWLRDTEPMRELAGICSKWLKLVLVAID
jgi:hypothetical protein